MSYRLGDMVAPALPEREALRSVVDEFAASITERRAPLTDGRSGLRVLALLEAAAESMASGGAFVPVLDADLRTTASSWSEEHCDDRRQRDPITGRSAASWSPAAPARSAPHVVDQLVDAGAAEVVVLDNLVRGRRENLAAAAERGGDAAAWSSRATSATAALVRRADQRHRPGLPPGRDPHHAVRRGAAAGHRVARRRHVQRARGGRRSTGSGRSIASSSASVYGLAEEFPTTERHHPYNNDTFYGAAKAFNEGMLRSFHAMYGLDYVALRYFNVYGPRMDIHGLYTEVLIRWMERIDAGEPPLIFGDGAQTMDFVHVARHRPGQHPGRARPP